MTPNSASQNSLLWAMVIIFVAYVGYGIVGKLGDNGSGLYVLPLLLGALPTFLVLAVLAVMYLKGQKKNTRVNPVPTSRKPVSVGRVVSTIMLIVALAIIGYIVYFYFSLSTALRSF